MEQDAESAALSSQEFDLRLRTCIALYWRQRYRQGDGSLSALMSTDNTDELVRLAERLVGHLHCDRDPIECSHAALVGEYGEMKRQRDELATRLRGGDVA